MQELLCVLSSFVTFDDIIGAHNNLLLYWWWKFSVRWITEKEATADDNKQKKNVKEKP